MKVDTGLWGGSFADIGERAKDLEAQGYSGAWTAETNHDPFLPIAQAATTTREMELGTSIAVAFARNPMLLANIGWDLQAMTNGRFVLGLGTTAEARLRLSGKDRGDARMVHEDTTLEAAPQHSLLSTRAAESSPYFGILDANRDGRP